MGYSTDFSGVVHISPEVSSLHEDLYAKMVSDAQTQTRNDKFPICYCQWQLNARESGSYLEWDGNEKFYDYVEWMRFIIDHWAIPNGYKLNGSITWSGDDPSDVGILTVKDNAVTAESVEDRIENAGSRIDMLEDALKMILSYQKNPIRRVKPARDGRADYGAPDWVQTKDRIFEIATKALK